MNVEIEGCGYIGMAEYHADSLIVALAFDATGSESMAQSMKHDLRNIEPSKQAAECLAISARFFSFGSVAHNIAPARLLTFYAA